MLTLTWHLRDPTYEMTIESRILQEVYIVYEVSEKRRCSSASLKTPVDVTRTQR